MAGSQTRKQRKLQKNIMISLRNNIPPDDVIFNNILIRLPSKQVARFRCVSKLWNAVLCQPSFIKSHLRHSIQAIKKHHNEFLLIFHDRFSFDKPCTAYWCTCPHYENVGLFKLPVKASSYVRGGSYVIGAVNGLICFANYTSGHIHAYVIHLWNPSLSALLALPPYNFIPSYSYEILFRFGFDPETDDYKVFKLAFRSGTAFKKWLHVEVYSMRNGSWKVINQRPPSHITMIHSVNERYVSDYDGYLHCFGYVDHDHMHRQAIVAFDLCLETFSEISLPDSIANSCYNIIGVLDEKLCVMSFTSRKDNRYEVWVMNEYGVAESWVQNHVFSRFSGMIHPFGFTISNQFIFEALDHEPLALYDSLETKVNYLNVSIFRKGLTKVVQYVDSLVWVSPAAEAGSTSVDSKLEETQTPKDIRETN